MFAIPCVNVIVGDAYTDLRLLKAIKDDGVGHYAGVRVNISDY